MAAAESLTRADPSIRADDRSWSRPGAAATAAKTISDRQTDDQDSFHLHAKRTHAHTRTHNFLSSLFFSRVQESAWK